MIEVWRMSNHMVSPHKGPNQEVKTDDIVSGEIWHKYSRALGVRWTSSWDCSEHTQWWYCIKDTPFVLSELKAKRRYEITKGSRNFTVRRLNSEEYIERMYDVYKDALTGYKNTPPELLNTFKGQTLPWFHYDSSIGGGREMLVYGAFNEDEQMCGYAHLIKYKDHCSFSTLKTRPSSESKGINAAICYQILSDLEEDLQRNDFFISDGARNLFHETHFQDYLEKYFCFRKAYCKLNVVWNPKISWIIKVLYPFRKLFLKLDDKKVFHAMNALLLSEDISRDCRNK